ncbi:unnamed protein product [Trifolium pratense]|uniref:Uncharacterized protein n=1 Tax=Trifolium pratense TaxID=57577 RepID=A0ACB0LTG7_TRIPR|nr:unnamed protein product [Trifolium pratense]
MDGSHTNQSFRKHVQLNMVCNLEERVQKVGQAHDNKENGEGGSPSSVRRFHFILSCLEFLCFRYVC